MQINAFLDAELLARRATDLVDGDNKEWRSNISFLLLAPEAAHHKFDVHGTHKKPLGTILSELETLNCQISSP